MLDSSPSARFFLRCRKDAEPRAPGPADTRYGGDRLFADMLAQAQLVDRLGFRGVTIPEHHLINILLIPDPLQFAVKVASFAFVKFSSKALVTRAASRTQ